MYNIKEISINQLSEINEKYGHTVFQTIEWVNFLIKNKKAKAVLLELSLEKKVVGYFIGLIEKKYGIKIFGSPFEGWLTPDMGFIVTGTLNYNLALVDVAKYSFNYLKCLFVQITDKKITFDMLDSTIYAEHSRTLYLYADKSADEILEGFSKNGRRDVRASGRKGIEVKKVPFDKEFIDIYYDQLIDVFAKQNLKPFYDRQKLYDLSSAFKENNQSILALEAYYEGKCIATNFSAATNEWAYYIGAASYRDYQKYLPNEALFWSFIKYWNENNIINFDLVGYREYKLKYNPEVVDVPVIIFAKYKVLIKMKKIAKDTVKFIRKKRGK